MDNDKILTTVAEIIKWDIDCILKYWLNKDGITITEGDMKSGDAVDSTPLIGDLGDYIQYIIYAGQILNCQSYIDWSVEQIRKIAFNFQDESGNIGLPKNSGYFKVIHREEAGDTIVGLANAYLLTRNEEIHKILDGYVDYWYKEIVINNNYSSVQIRYSKISLNLPYSHPALLGNIAEECLLLFQFTQSEKYLILARTIIDKLVNNYYFQKFHLFPIKFLTFSNNLKVILIIDKLLMKAAKLLGKNPVSILQTLVSKSNSNPGSALTEFIKCEKEDSGIYRSRLNQWVNTFKTTFFQEEPINRVFYHPFNGTAPVKSLGHIHPAINNLLDVAVFTDSHQLLSLCAKGVEYLLDKMTGIDILPVDIDPDSETALLDPNIDLAVLLFKLHELTVKQLYFDKATSIIKSIATYYKAPYGLAAEIDKQTGRIVDYKNALKFHTLALKGFCVLYQKLKGFNIKDDRKLYYISRDR